MKQLELKLKKRLLVVELPENKLFSQEKQIKALIESDKWLHGLLSQKRNLKLICKGYELTEEKCEDLMSLKESYPSISQYLNDVIYTNKEKFIKMIEKEGYYWGENPIPKPLDYLITQDSDAWFMADVLTFDLNKTLIFEIT